MSDWLRAQARANPNAIAVIASGQTLRYAELDRLASHVAQGLARHNIAPAMPVGVLMGSNLATIVAIHALMRLRATLVMLNTRLTANELVYQIQLAQCPLLLCDDEGALRPEALARATNVSVVHIGDLDPSDAAIADTGLTKAPFTPATLSDDSPLAIMFTSGTSGKPKGAVLTRNNFWHSAMASAYRLGVMPNDRWLCAMPLYHVGGLSIVMRSCLYGTAIDLRPKFTVDEVSDALSRQPITLISLVPTMLQRLLDHTPAPNWPHLRLCLLGGAATSGELLARAQAARVACATSYGLTEATSQVATTLPADAARKPASVGKPLLFTEVRVINEAGEAQPAGEYGEIIVRGPTVMRGYLGADDGAASAAKSLRNGWFHTGDIGYLDHEADLHLVQRRSDLIVSGGENVYPAEVEAVLRKHAPVAAAVAGGVPSV
ncbi:MAG: AMP-binding protein, partial [Anaerolineae bacterium]|nr:AMP-binding protein [Anaerolineae bacterium]